MASDKAKGTTPEPTAPTQAALAARGRRQDTETIAEEVEEGPNSPRDSTKSEVEEDPEKIKMHYFYEGVESL